MASSTAIFHAPLAGGVITVRQTGKKSRSSMQAIIPRINHDARQKDGPYT
jgi:hypothetical protein